MTYCKNTLSVGTVPALFELFCPRPPLCQPSATSCGIIDTIHLFSISLYFYSTVQKTLGTISYGAELVKTAPISAISGPTRKKN
jgi:hypothetical protein